jgi:hypothetical protein
MEPSAFDDAQAMKKAADKITKARQLQMPRIGMFDATRCPGAKVRYFMLSDLSPTDRMLTVLQRVADRVGLPVDKILVINEYSFAYRDASWPLKYYAQDIEFHGYTTNNNEDARVMDDDCFDVKQYSSFFVLLRDNPMNLAKKLKQNAF